MIQSFDADRSIFSDWISCSFVSEAGTQHFQATWSYSSDEQSHKSVKFSVLRLESFFATCPLSKLSLASFFMLTSGNLYLLRPSTACPPGTYKPEGAPGGPGTCLPCPDAQHTSQPGSTSVNDCVCKPGYQPIGMTCQSKWGLTPKHNNNKKNLFAVQSGSSP